MHTEKIVVSWVIFYIEITTQRFTFKYYFPTTHKINEFHCKGNDWGNNIKTQDFPVSLGRVNFDLSNSSMLMKNDNERKVANEFNACCQEDSSSFLYPIMPGKPRVESRLRVGKEWIQCRHYTWYNYKQMFLSFSQNCDFNIKKQILSK